MAGCVRSRVEEEALERLRPSPREYKEVMGFAEELVSFLSEVLWGLGVKPRIEGSVAKDTWLSGSVDVDVFVLFPRDYCLSMTTERLIDYIEHKASGRYMVERRYANHPYIRLGRKGLWADIVPGCLIGDYEPPLTPVDRTPRHTEYVRRVLEREQRDEVRLLKAFTKAVGVYGAEVEVAGFSGYLLELLVASYKCFRGVLEAAASWSPPVYIAPPGTSIDDARRLRRRYPDSVMYVPDPVDPARNVAAAVSKRSLASFITAARIYLENPLLELLDPGLWSRLEPPEPVATVVALLLEPLEPRPAEVVAGVAARAARAAANMLREAGFTVLDVEARRCGSIGVGAIVVLEEELPPLLPHRGPPAWAKNSSAFTSKYLAGPSPRGPWVSQDGRLYVLRPPRARRPRRLLEMDTSWIPGSAKGWRIRVAGIHEAVSACPELGGWLRWLAAAEPPWIHAARMHRVRRASTSCW